MHLRDLSGYRTIKYFLILKAAAHINFDCGLYLYTETNNRINKWMHKSNLYCQNWGHTFSIPFLIELWYILVFVLKLCRPKVRLCLKKFLIGHFFEIYARVWG